jgi:hypothetical protein
MAEKMSTGLCQYMMQTGSFKAAFTNMELRIYGGTVPATADAAPASPTPICVVKNGGSYATFGTATAGVVTINLTETWTGTNASSATATFYRLVSNADANDSSATSPRVQGTIGTTGGFDMNVGSAALVNAATFTVNTFTQSLIPS